LRDKQRLYIYGRREIVILLFLAFMVTLFAFTLGVHFGKNIGGPKIETAKTETAVAGMGQDKVPNRQELAEQSVGVNQAADETMNQALHEEVVRTGLKLDRAMQVELPEKTKAPTKGATTNADKKSVAAVAEHVAEDKPQEDQVEVGKYTLQIGAFRTEEEAKDRVSFLEAAGQKPFYKNVDLKSKGKWYRVYLGHYRSSEQAEEAGLRYKAQNVIESFVVSNKLEN